MALDRHDRDDCYQQPFSGTCYLIDDQYTAMVSSILPSNNYDNSILVACNSPCYPDTFWGYSSNPWDQPVRPQDGTEVNPPLPYFEPDQLDSPFPELVERSENPKSVVGNRVEDESYVEFCDWDNLCPYQTNSSDSECHGNALQQYSSTLSSTCSTPASLLAATPTSSAGIDDLDVLNNSFVLIGDLEPSVYGLDQVLDVATVPTDIACGRKWPKTALDRKSRPRRGRETPLAISSTRRFQCDRCDRCFGRNDHLKRHMRSLHTSNAKLHQCSTCEQYFSRADNLAQHKRTHCRTSNKS